MQFRRLRMLTVLFASMCAACGRSATREDCELVVGRIVELRMRSLNLGTPAEIDAKRTEILKDSAVMASMSQCVGKRISPSSLECVKRAEREPEVAQCLK